MLLAAALCLAFAVPATPITETSLAAALDPVFAKCGPTGTPGAAISVVHGGQLVFLKGYGTANPSTGEPVDPARHLFRAASVSKLFTATAVMQLVEQGKVDLDADVNTYLHPPIVPEAFGKPITLRNLLQHAAGFDDEFLGMARETSQDLPTLKEYLATGLPKRVFEPGHFASYSNHGVALAGLVVEEVSGQPFAAYVRDHIFSPLGMQHSHFDLVPTAETPLALGHWRGLFGGPLQPAGYDYPLTVPSSTLATTVDDMAKFMLTHLGQGPPILKPETLQFMHAPTGANAPGLAIGFFDRHWNGRKTLTHTGHIWGYATILFLCPEEKLGVYITLSTEDSGMYDRALAALMDAFFPAAESEVLQLPITAKANPALAPLAGIYRFTRYPRHSFLKFGLLMSGRVSEVEIRPSDDGGLSMAGRKLYPSPSDAGSFVPGRRVDDNTVELTVGSEYRFLSEEYRPLGSAPDSPAQFLLRGSSTYERIGQLERTSLLQQLAVGCLLTQLLVLALAPIWWGIQKWRGKRQPREIVAARTMMLAAIVAVVLFAVGVGAILGTLNPLAVAYGPPRGLLPLLCLPLISTVLAITSLGALIVGLRRISGRLSLFTEVSFHFVAALSLAVLLSILYYWNLLGFRLG